MDEASTDRLPVTRPPSRYPDADDVPTAWIPVVRPQAAWRRTVSRLVRYGLVGVANAAVYYTTYRLVLGPLGYLLAHAAGLAVAMVVSYFLHCRFTFAVRPTWRRFLRFPWSQATNVLATTVGVVALVHLGVGERVAPLAAAVVAVPVTFLLTTLALTGRRTRAGH